MSELEKTINLLTKKYGAGVVGYASKFKGLDIKRYPTGSFGLDIELGGGLPTSRIIELYGELSSGKTMMTLKMIAEIQKLKKKVVYIDAEGVFSPDWAKKLGVDLGELILSRAETAEEMLTIAEACVRSGDCGLMVIDSVAALMPMQEEEVGMDESETLGNRARMMNRFVRRLHSALNLKNDEVPNECIVVLINQTRDAIGKYGDPTVTPGGKGIGFGASVRIQLRRKDWLKEGTGEKEAVVGQNIFFRITKSKVFTPYREGNFDFYFSNTESGMRAGEIDTIKEIITYGIFYGIIKQGGPYFSFGEQKFQGKDKLVDFFKDKSNLSQVAKIKAEITAVALRSV